MSGLRNKLIVFAALGGLAVVGSLMNSKQAAAAGGPSVTIDGPLPLPVTGSTTVSGSVSATQSGTWNVGIAGTPSMNVASLPAVQLSGTPTVNVATPSGTPLLVVNLGDKGRTSYQSSKSCIVAPCPLSFPAVPSGHRLVVESVSVHANYGSPFSTPPFARLNAREINLPLTPTSATSASGTQPVLVYFDSGSQPDIDVIPGPDFVIVTLSGYLVDCSLAPCAPIAQ